MTKPASTCSGAVRTEQACKPAALAAVFCSLAASAAARSFAATAILVCFATSAAASTFAAPGDPRLRYDLQLLADARVINVPLSTWPLSWPDVVNALDAVEPEALNAAELAAYARLREHARDVTGTVRRHLSASAATKPRIIRTFHDTPRENGEIAAGLSWTGNRFAAQLSAAYVSNPADGDHLRPDGTYLGMTLGNWMLSAGWQERWWGPGHDGSLILSNNARPVPAVGLQRKQSKAFESRWLRWIGPWTLTTFMGLLDDDRFIDDALLFGLRGVFRPHPSLEIGFSRTAQWCGEGRECDGSTFIDLLLGRDNRGVNVDPDDEPGNQLGGADLRWALPGMPLAVYAQWIAEDTRRGGPEIGNWLRLAGVEHWGRAGALQHRTHFEVADTSCRMGGLGFSEVQPNCGYEHSIFRSGYRYHNRPLAHGIDGDGLSYSLGTTLVHSTGHTWNVTVRHMDINRVGAPDARHSVSATPLEWQDVQLTHRRVLDWGVIDAGLGYRRIDADTGGTGSNDVTGFIQWSLQ